MTLHWWQAGALQVISSLGESDDKLNNIISWNRWCCLTTGQGRTKGTRSKIEPQCNYYTINRTLTDPLLNVGSGRITQIPVAGWIGRWWRALQMSCAFMIWRVIQRYVPLCRGSEPKQLRVTFGVFSWRCHAEGFKNEQAITASECCSGTLRHAWLVTDQHMLKLQQRYWPRFNKRLISWRPFVFACLQLTSLWLACSKGLSRRCTPFFCAVFVGRGLWVL